MKLRAMNINTNHADVQYTDRKRLDLAVPSMLFPNIVYGLQIQS